MYTVQILFDHSLDLYGFFRPIWFLFYANNQETLTKNCEHKF